MTNHDHALRDLILQYVPEDGGSIGNKVLLDQLTQVVDFSFTEEDYCRVRDGLLADGLLTTGRGRDGSVMRTQQAPISNSSMDDDADGGDGFDLEIQQARESDSAPVRSRTPRASSGPRASKDQAKQVISYHYGDKRKNNPHVGMVNITSDGVEEEIIWAYDPHIDPALNFDSGRSQIENLIDDALVSGDEAVMRQALEQLRRMQAPYLNWTGKAERPRFEVDTVSLHVHERIDPATILATVRGDEFLVSSFQFLEKNARNAATAPLKTTNKKLKTSWRQPDLFSAPFENLPLREAIDFYKHDRDWANRLIAGDSLLVMNSLLQKESMAGQVQMIYIDPPYGIKYGSNFQPFVNKRDVKDRKDEDLTQEPEMIKAFRDTWELGIHSYLTYLRDRLLLARELLSESGSVFVQISDENLHHVTEMMDEVFGPANRVAIVTIVKTSAQEDLLLPSVCDYLVWYAKNKSVVKYNKIWLPKKGDAGAAEYNRVEVSGIRRRMTAEEQDNPSFLPEGARSYRQDNIVSQRPPGDFPVEFEGITYRPITGYWKTGETGFQRLTKSRRIEQRGRMLSYVRFFDDFPVKPISNFWPDVRFSSRSEDKAYVVQTAARVIERCLLMTTDPGDLVLDPTCGSGTTAFVAEKWGRRWITCDTSRVAVTLAKQRLITASFDYYELKYSHEGLKSGFIYKTVPHVTLKSIANNPEIDEIYERMHPTIETALQQLNEFLVSSFEFLVDKTGDETTKSLKTNNLKLKSLAEWEVPFDLEKLISGLPEDASLKTNNSKLKTLFTAFHAARQAMQKKMDESIAAHADQEILYDQPEKSKTKLRITGPFTVEAVPFPTVLALDEAEQPPAADMAVARSGETSRQAQWRDELLKAGIRGKGGQKLKLADLEPLPGMRYLHAVGTIADTGERVAVSFGPEHAALEQRQVEIAMREAGELFPLPKMLVFCAFTFDPEAAKDIDTIRGITALKVQMNTDLLTEDLKKARANNESFWLMGQPDVEVFSCEFLVVSEVENQWRVGRYDWIKELSGLGGLAEIHGLGRDGLFLYALLSQGRTVWDYLSDAQGWDLHSGEYRGRTGAKQSAGIPAVSWDSERLPGGVGNLDSALREAGLPGLREFKTIVSKLRRNPETPRRLEKVARTLKFPLATQKTQNLKLKTLHQVEVHGFDYFDTTSGELKSGGKNKIALWLLDTDYDDRSLYPKQVFFPMAGAKDGWNKLKKDIKAELNEALLAQFHGTTSLPFEAGDNRRIAVKIVDDRGIESLKVIDLN